MSKITSLEVENVKRIKAIRIVPHGSTVVIGGENDQGKSSVLDSIMYALSGGKSLPALPLRNGSKKGHVKMTIDGTEHGSLIVERTFTERGSALVITTKDGYEAPTPQKILNDLCGLLAFDPLAFTREQPKQQLDSLRSLVGIDTTALDNERAAAFQTRTGANREIKALSGELAGLEHHLDAPAEGVSVIQLANRVEAIRNENAANESKREGHQRAGELIARKVSERDRVLEKIAILQSNADALASEIEDASSKFAEDSALVASLVDQDTTALRRAMESAEGINARVRANARRAEVQARLDAKREWADTLTESIEAIDAKKADMMAAAKFPVEGLGFSDDGITFNGLPFDQASSSQRIKVSAAIGLAMNPNLRVMLIRDGSLLGDGALATLAAMAEAADAQVWIERVSTGSEVSVIIEDGSVKERQQEESKELDAALAS